MSIYRSNLTCPDLTHNFRWMHSRVQGQSMGHDVPSDWSDKPDDDPFFGVYKRCGMWTHDEAAILFRIVESASDNRKEFRASPTPLWLDIGAHTGWTSAHIAAAGASVIAVEPMLWNSTWFNRFASNVGVEVKHGHIMPWAGRSEQFFSVLSGNPAPMFDGIVIDGDHEPVCVRDDVFHAHTRLKPNGVILMHDFIGAWKESLGLLEAGYKCRVYMTPHVIGCFWNGDWMPPCHVPDPAIDWQEIRTNHMAGFPWEMTI